MIKTIIFDIGGVVVQADFQKIYAEFAEKVGLRAEIVEQYFKENFSTLKP